MRALGADDLAAVGDLLDAAERVDGNRAVDDRRWLEMTTGAGQVLAGFVAREGGGVVGYAQVGRERTGWALDLVVHPDRRDDTLAIGSELVAAACGAVADHGGGHVDLWVRRPTGAHDAVAATAGLTGRRDLFELRRPLPAEPPPAGLHLRPFRPGDDHDAEAWLVVNNRAFSWHPDQGGWDRRTLEERQREPWFDAGGFLLHERDGRLAGFCWTKVHADTDPPLGEIYVIAVDPDYQGLGLGRALVLAGLDHLARQGLTTGMLYVDADNASAVALYESLGFEVHHVDRAYGGDLAPSGDDPTGQTPTPAADPTTEPMA